MCSVGDSEYSENKFMEEKQIPSEQTPCLKCQDINSTVLIRSKDWYCTRCFLSSLSHKFRSVLGKNRLARNNERVLIIYSGGYTSSVLLHLINQSIKSSKHKKLMIRPFILYIDNGAVINNDNEERLKISKNILKECSNYEFPAYISSISTTLYGSSQEQCLMNLENYNSFIAGINDGPLINLLACSTASAKLDLCNLLRRKLILHVAYYLKCDYVFVPEMASNIACNTMIGFSLGKASHVTMDTGLRDTRDENIIILRPLREFTYEEVVLYCMHNNINPILIDEPGDNDDVYSSIQNIIKKFIYDLQVNFPATINTVVKVSDKLTTKNEADLENGVCRMCQAPLDTKVADGATVRNAIAFSHIASIKSAQMVAKQSYEWQDVNEEILKNKFDTNNSLCHGCYATFQEISNKDILDKYLIEDQ